MARITVEDCLQRENNRFALVQLASKRSKQILGGSRVVIPVEKGNKAVVNSLREIAEGKVRFMTAEEFSEFQARQEERAREAREAAEKLRTQSHGLADIFKETAVFSGSNGDSNGSVGDAE